MIIEKKEKILFDNGTSGTYIASIFIRAFDFYIMRFFREIVNQCLKMWFIFHKIVPLLGSILTNL
jgi:hypothetical protein